MNATCYKSPSHRLFKRPVELQVMTHEIVDEKLHHLGYDDRAERYVRRRFTGVYCAECATPANVSLAPDAWKPSSN